LVKKGAIWKYGLAVAIGILVGYRVVPPTIIGIVYMLMISRCIIFAAQNKLDKFFTYVPFLIYTEVFERVYASSIVPYLAMQYMYVIAFSILIINYAAKNPPHSKAYYLLIFFGILEVVNGLSPDRPILLRAIFFNSFSLILAVVWASHTRLSPNLINKIFANVKLAGIYLAGIILVAHLKGTIVYGTLSSSTASNGLAPVQISGYLGFASSLLFIATMSPHEKALRSLNLAAFCFVSIIMVLTLSRGGLFFLGSVVLLYLLFNRQNLGSYFKYLLLVPIVMIIFNFVVEETGGHILKRYEEKGASGRDKLVDAGFILFAANPIFGVGTSNFGTAIVKYKLYGEESTAHDEFVRAIAEHGIFGLFTYWGFFAILLFTILKRKEPNRQFSIYFFTLFCLIVVHNGLKISTQQLILILAIANPSMQMVKKKMPRLVTTEAIPIRQSA
jgi:O-antigen ligase